MHLKGGSHDDEEVTAREVRLLEVVKALRQLLTKEHDVRLNKTLAHSTIGIMMMQS